MVTILQEKRVCGMEKGVNMIPNQRWESKKNALYLSSYAKKIYDKSGHFACTIQYIWNA